MSVGQGEGGQGEGAGGREAGGREAGGGQPGGRCQPGGGPCHAQSSDEEPETFSLKVL